MGRTMVGLPELSFDDDAFVPLTLHVPASLYRTLHRYCAYRGAGSDMIAKAAAAAVRWYFERHAGFQTWLREQPEAPVTLPQSAVRPTRRRRQPPANSVTSAP